MKTDVLPAPVRTILNGISEVFIVTNPWAGLLILAGIATASLPMAGLVLLGTVVSTLAAAWATSPTREAVHDGLCGYNGALIGAAAFLTWGSFWPAVAATVIGGFACATLAEALSRLMATPALKPFSLPILTAPFCITSGIIALLGAVYVPGSPMNPLSVQSPLQEAADAILGNVSEVVLVDSLPAGLLILAGLAIANWRVAVAALLGAVGEFAIDLLTSHDIDKLVHGLLGYSGVLVVIALGVVFVKGSLARRAAAAAVGLLISQLVAIGMSHTAIPTYTWPFILPTWLVLAGLAWYDSRKTTTAAAAH